MAIQTTSKLSEYTDKYFKLYEHFSVSTDAVCSSSSSWGPEIVRDYTEEDQCEYCGNMSKLRDARGNCPSCGANRKEPK